MKYGYIIIIHFIRSITSAFVVLFVFFSVFFSDSSAITNRSSAGPRWVSLQHPAHPSQMGNVFVTANEDQSLAICGNRVGI